VRGRGWALVGFVVGLVMGLNARVLSQFYSTLLKN
jgi:hypothetical protein